MGFYLDITEAGGQEIIVLKRIAYVSWGFLIIIALYFLNAVLDIVNPLLILIPFALLFALSIPYLRIGLALRRKMKSGEVTVSGSRYSFSNPITYKCRK